MGGPSVPVTCMVDDSALLLCLPGLVALLLRSQRFRLEMQLASHTFPPIICQELGSCKMRDVLKHAGMVLQLTNALG